MLALGMDRCQAAFDHSLSVEFDEFVWRGAFKIEFDGTIMRHRVLEGTIDSRILNGAKDE